MQQLDDNIQTASTHYLHILLQAIYAFSLVSDPPSFGFVYSCD